MARKKVEEAKREQKFNVSDILKSKKYEKNRDVLASILKEKEKYSHTEIEKLLQNFNKKEVE